MNSLLPDTSKYDLALQLRACQSNARRNGKVARLPANLRDQINRMIDDGVQYKAIIKSLGDAGKHLNEDNLSNWRLGGYQDYLKTQAINLRAQIQTETAADFLRQDGHLNPIQLQHTCGELALLHYLRTMMEHGDQLAADSFKKNPAKFITLMNACANMSNAHIALEKNNWKISDRQPLAPASPPPSSPSAQSTPTPSAALRTVPNSSELEKNNLAPQLPVNSVKNQSTISPDP